MTHRRVNLLIWPGLGLLVANSGFAMNPLIVDQFTADPTARVFENKVFVYPSHDIKAPPEYHGRPNWFCMEDYHVFSSENLTDWTDHGVILSQTQVDWVNPTGYSMWAPDCVFKNGNYYFYFPALAKTGGFKIGVAIATRPFGPFKPETQPIDGVRGIDPCVFIDKDGTAYLFYSLSKIYVAKLKPDMLAVEGAPAVLENLPSKGLLEGPFVFERNGIYYLTYPHVENKSERLEYAIGNSPLGPFKPAGVILDEAASGCWTVHHSIVLYQGQWYLFYHDDDLSPTFDKNRSIRADRLAFNEDGTIKKVIPTLRGVGVVDAKREIQVDRYSARSESGASATFLDEQKPGAGWKVVLETKGAWVRFDEVDFGQGGQGFVEVRAAAVADGLVEIHLDKAEGPLLAKVSLEKNSTWTVVRTAAAGVPSGIHNLVIVSTTESRKEVDWISFK